MTRNLLVFSSILLFAGCGAQRSVIRDAAVYQAELDQYDRWATGQAAHLRKFIGEHCECGSDPEGGPFATSECKEAADFVLTVEARAEWHKSMSLWNAGLLQEEPPASPPAIAPLSCPLPPAAEGTQP
jgi:hypothetical protein